MDNIGLGTCNLEYYRDKDFDFKESLKYAIINIGYRTIDTASSYNNEELIGEVLQEIFNDLTLNIKREDIFVITKNWNDERENVEEALKRSLKKLKLDYVDLYLLHHSMTVELKKNTNKILRLPLHNIWRQMETCVTNNLCKEIGTSNFNCQIIMDLLTYANIKPSYNQIEVHPYLNQKEFIKFLNRFNIKVIAYCPLARGEWLEQHNNTDLLKEPIILELAKKYEKTAAQICLKWGLQNGYNIIPRSSKIDRLKENFNCTDFFIEENDMQNINSLNKNFRIVDIVELKNECNIPLFK